MSEIPVELTKILKGEFQAARLMSGMAMVAGSVQFLIEEGGIPPISYIAPVVVWEAGPNHEAYIVKKMGARIVIAVDDRSSKKPFYKEIPELSDEIIKEKITIEDWLLKQADHSIPLILGYELAPRSIFDDMSFGMAEIFRKREDYNRRMSMEIGRVLTDTGIVLLQGSGRPSMSSIFDPLQAQLLTIEREVTLPRELSKITYTGTPLTHFAGIVRKMPMILLRKK